MQARRGRSRRRRRRWPGRRRGRPGSTRTAISPRLAMSTLRTWLLPGESLGAYRPCIGVGPSDRSRTCRDRGRRARVSQIWLLRWARVDDAHDDPRPGPVDAAGARLRRPPRAAELERRQVGERAARLDLPRAAQADRGRAAARGRPPSRSAARPARTTYQITAKGAGRVRDLLRELLVGAVSRRSTRSMAAFAFLPALPREEAAAALRNRAARAARPRCESAARVDRVATWMRDDKPIHVTLDVRAGDRPVRGGDRLVRADRRADRVGSVVRCLAYAARVAEYARRSGATDRDGSSNNQA